MAVLAALHNRFGRAARGRAWRSWLLHMLTLRYYGPALIMRGIGDFTAGPAIVRQDPRPLHAGITAIRHLYGPRAVRRKEVLDPPPVACIPQAHFVTLGYLGQTGWCGSLRQA